MSATIGKWLAPLGHIVCAAKDRDLSAAEQSAQVNSAHTDIYNVLREMDAVQIDLLEALEDCADWLDWLYHPDHDDKQKSNIKRIKKARAAIARAKGEQA